MTSPATGQLNPGDEHKAGNHQVAGPAAKAERVHVRTKPATDFCQVPFMGGPQAGKMPAVMMSG